MPDDGTTIENASAKAGWFAAGAITVAAAICLFLYADGYFESSTKADASAQAPELIIEGQ